jgi:hypothetical protein
MAEFANKFERGIWDSEKYDWFIENLAKDFMNSNLSAHQICRAIYNFFHSIKHLKMFLESKVKVENCSRKFLKDIQNQFIKNNCLIDLIKAENSVEYLTISKTPNFDVIKENKNEAHETNNV